MILKNKLINIKTTQRNDCLVFTDHQSYFLKQYLICLKTNEVFFFSMRNHQTDIKKKELFLDGDYESARITIIFEFFIIQMTKKHE